MIACFIFSIASSSSVPNLKIAFLRVRRISGRAIIEYPLMNILRTPLVPRNPRTSVTVVQAGQSLIFCTFWSSGTRPSKVHLWPTISPTDFPSRSFLPEIVPPYAPIRVSILLTSCACSQTNRRMPSESGIISYEPSSA